MSQTAGVGDSVLVNHANSDFLRKVPCSHASFCLVHFAAHGRYAQKLMNDLFSNYTNALRPVEDTDHVINVTLQITLSQIIDMVTVFSGL